MGKERKLSRFYKSLTTAHTKMQKAKVGDLIYFDRDYWRVIEVGPKSVDAQKLRTETFYEICHGNYQIAFSPHAESWPSSKSIQSLAKAVAEEINSDAKQRLEVMKVSSCAGDEASQEPERAHIGDIIRNFKGQLMTVERVDAASAYGHEYASPHGTYTIVKRASDKSEYKQEPSTAELVAMLTKRTGVAINTLSEDYAIRIVDVTTDPKMVVGVYQGPCAILVIPEAGE